MYTGILNDKINVPGLSVVIPVYNEDATIRVILKRVAAAPAVSEIVVVDDGSTDGTREQLGQLRSEMEFTLVLQGRNRGKGAAVRTGFQHATREFVVVQDADLEYNPADYSKMLAPIAEGRADAVYGSRFLGRAEMELWHTLANRSITFLGNLFNRLHLTDMETCYKIFRTKDVQSMDLECDGFAIEPELTAKLVRLKRRILEVPISYSRRSIAEGKKIRLIDVVPTVAAIIRYGMFR